jgi:hypothetical protein
MAVWLASWLVNENERTVKRDFEVLQINSN